MKIPDIQQLIPQRPPMMLVDALLEADEQGGLSCFEVKDGGLFVSDGFFQEAGLLENMAQTAAAWSGMQAFLQSRPPDIGFIGGLGKVGILENPPVGARLITRIRILHEVMNATIAEGTIFRGDARIASCELKIFLNP
jgi:predicted hotdog family 3-hydroxylacyl-ACP dehydratase